MKYSAFIFIISMLIYGQGLEYGGYLHIDQRVQPDADYRVAYNEYRLSLKFEAATSGRIHFYSETWLRAFGLPEILTSSDLVCAGQTQGVDLLLREAYIDFYGFLIKPLDLRLGRQRIAWGSGDKINPTDNLNPYDFEDIWDFGRHSGSEALRFFVYGNNWNLDLAFVPVFKPAILPADAHTQFFNPGYALSGGIPLKEVRDSIIMPGAGLKEQAQSGLRFKTVLAGYDLSISYALVNSGLPVVHKLVLTPDTSGNAVNLFAELYYPRQQVIGADLAGAIGDLGVWLEAAAFLPEEVNCIIDQSHLGLGVEDSLVLEHKFYIKYLLGADYTLQNGLYINLQYLHGLIQEQCAQDLEDYIFLGMEWKLLNDRLKIAPLNGALEIKTFNDIRENLACALLPQLFYYPFDNAEISIGAHLVYGNEGTRLGGLHTSNEFFLKAQYSF